MSNLWGIGTGDETHAPEKHTLNEATNAQEILNAITGEIWNAEGYEGAPPAVPTPGDLSNPDWWDFLSNDNAVAVFNELYKQWKQIRKEATALHRQETKEDREALLECHPGPTDEQIRAIAEKEIPAVETLKEKSHNYFMLTNFFVTAWQLLSIGERIEVIHEIWLIARKTNPQIGHPLAPIVRQFLIEQAHRTIESATVDHVKKLATCPYAVSEVNRRKWGVDSSVEAIEVDGEPIITQLKKLPGPFVKDSDEAKLFKPVGTAGELMPMPNQRDNSDIPIPLVAYRKYGHNLRSALPSDVAQLLTLAYAANEPMKLTINEGARLLARGQDGQLGRQVREADEQRFEDAFACIHGMAAWIVAERNIARFYPLTACDRFSDGSVSIAPASWARDRSKGRWTLTAGFGVAGQNRLKGNAHNNNVWRVITGVEYWLARERFAGKGTYKGTSQALIPASGTAGPGSWYTLSWQELMMIAGDVWDQNDPQASNRSYKRFQKIRAALIQHGYQVKNLNKSAEAGDTVEFLFGGKDGKVKVRATERFVEGARKAKRQDWQTANLTDYLGL